MAEYIDRGALLEKLKERDLCLCVSESDIKEAPAADVAPVVHGRWIDFAGLLFEPNKCSACGGLASNTESMKYCPNCGAKMDLDAE